MQFNSFAFSFDAASFHSKRRPTLRALPTRTLQCKCLQCNRTVGVLCMPRPSSVCVFLIISPSITESMRDFLQMKSSFSILSHNVIEMEAKLKSKYFEIFLPYAKRYVEHLSNTDSKQCDRLLCVVLLTKVCRQMNVNCVHGQSTWANTHANMRVYKTCAHHDVHISWPTAFVCAGARQNYDAVYMWCVPYKHMHMLGMFGLLSKITYLRKCWLMPIRRAVSNGCVFVSVYIHFCLQFPGRVINLSRAFPHIVF